MNLVNRRRPAHCVIRFQHLLNADDRSRRDNVNQLPPEIRISRARQLFHRRGLRQSNR